MRQLIYFKILMIATVAIFTSSPALANNYFDKSEKCLQVSDVESIINHFKQFEIVKKWKVQDTNQYCPDKSIEENNKWFEIIRSVLAIQRLKLDKEIDRDPNDDLTLKPLGGENWWNYFTNRANQFDFEPTFCKEHPEFWAFINHNVKGRVNLCSDFFKISVSSQISILLHEVRHFDGFGHVTCSQGPLKGIQGYCDDSIHDGGSYAVGTQAYVELSFASQLNEAERILAESSAIFSINAKFNKLPKVKYSEYVYASNKDKEVWRIPRDNQKNAKLITTLDEPSYIYSYYNQVVTLFPINPEHKATRFKPDFSSQVESVGTFANFYNSNDPESKSHFGPIQYEGLGGITKDNVLYALCGESRKELQAIEFENGSIQALVFIEDETNYLQNHILSDSGDMFLFSCDEDSGKLSITKTENTLPPETAMASFFNHEKAFILTTDGKIKAFNMKSQTYEEDISDNTNWLSIGSTFRIYSLYDTDQN